MGLRGLAGKTCPGQGHSCGLNTPVASRVCLLPVSHSALDHIFGMYSRGLTTLTPQSSHPPALAAHHVTSGVLPSASLCGQRLPHSWLCWCWPQFRWERAGRRLPRWDVIPPFSPPPQGYPGMRAASAPAAVPVPITGHCIASLLPPSHLLLPLSSEGPHCPFSHLVERWWGGWGEGRSLGAGLEAVLVPGVRTAAWS